MEEIGGDGKIPYTPSEEKRFEVSEDPYSRERVQQLHAAYKEVREAMPEISVAFTLGGSLAKGKKLTVESVPETDIDLRIFIDRDDVEQKAKDVAAKSPVFANIYHSELKYFEELFDDNEFSREERDQTAAWRATRSIIDLALDKDLKQGINLNSQLEDYYSRTDIYNNRDMIAMSGDRSIMDTLGHFKREAYDLDAYYTQPSRADLAHCFGLDIGGGMRKYIQKFLRDLGEKEKITPGAADEEWKWVKMAVEDIERGDNIPSNIKHQFPQNYKEACNRYGVEFNQKH